MNNPKLSIQDIPWSRIVHWYGRATDYPDCFQAIEFGSIEEQQAAFNLLKSTIVHQNGVIYATPFAIPFIVDLLHAKQTNTVQLLVLIKLVVDAVYFTYYNFEIDEKQPNCTIHDLLSEQYLWPEFTSEYEDINLWLELPFEPQMWLECTVVALLEKLPKIQATEISHDVEEDYKLEIVEKVNRLANFEIKL